MSHFIKIFQAPSVRAEILKHVFFYFIRIFHKIMMYWGIFVFAVLTASGLVRSTNGG